MLVIFKRLPRQVRSKGTEKPFNIVRIPNIHVQYNWFRLYFSLKFQENPTTWEIQYKHIFISRPLLAYRRNTNLKQILVQSSLNLKPNGTQPCGHSLCHSCEHTNPSDTISGPNKTFHNQQHFTCLSVCIIYSITCTKCAVLYIGETCHQLSDMSLFQPCPFYSFIVFLAHPYTGLLYHVV